MDDSKKDLDVLSYHSATESQFLQQVKECQYHLNCMEKLFTDLQKIQCEKETKKSRTSLNSKFSKSFPDLQLLMSEYESKVNKKSESFTKNSSECAKEVESILVEPVIDNDNATSLTFVVQVPNALLDILKRKISNDSLFDVLSENSAKISIGSKQRKGIFWFVRKLFKRKKRVSTIPDIKISKNDFKFSKSENGESTISSFQHSGDISLNYSAKTEMESNARKCCTTENFDNIDVANKSTDSTQSQNLILPITYNFDGKTFAMPNVCIQHKIKPQFDSNTFSHSIQIKNELPTEYFNKSSETTVKDKESVEIDDRNGKEINSTELLIDSLIKTLHKTTEKLDNLESIKALVEKLGDEEVVVKKSDENCKSPKSKLNKKSKFFNNLLRVKPNDNETNEHKLPKKNVEKVPKRQSSKLSICSNSNSVTSDEDIYKSSMTNSRLQHIQRLNRCQSPSMFNYLVCQSERDVDYKVNTFR